MFCVEVKKGDEQRELMLRIEKGDVEGKGEIK